MTHVLSFRVRQPADGPAWLPDYSRSIEGLFRQMMPGPLHLHGYSTAEIPDPTAESHGVILDHDIPAVKYAMGGAWIRLQDYDATLAALAALDSSAGVLVQTGADTFAKRTLAGTANRITVTNGDGAAGAPTFDISSSYVGQNTITTLGTIGTGVWQGTAVAAGFGGTGLTSYAVGDLLYASATTPTLSKLAAVATGNALISGGLNTAPSWGKIGLTTHVSGTLAAGNGGTGVTALGDITRTNDTNVTLTLGGTPTGAVITSTSFTLGWSGQLSVARGGTGAATLTGLLVGNGTSAFTTVTPGTGVTTALAVNVGSAGAFVTFNGALGTPSSGTLTNCTGLPIAGLTASTSTAIGVGSIELGHASDTTLTRVSAGVVAIEGANILVSGGALGTPSSGTLTNATGLPISTGVSGLGAGVATFLATPSSANLRAALTDETGTGAAVFADSPALTGNIGVNVSPSKPLHVYNSSAAVGQSSMTVQGGDGGYGAGYEAGSILTGGAYKALGKIVWDGESSWNTTASTQDSYVTIWTTVDGTLTERMRIDSAGLVTIGSLRVNQTPTSAANTATHYVTMNFNGTDYKVLLHS